MKPIQIENWAVVTSGDPYTPPECRVQCLSSTAVNHPRLGGQHVTTSKLVGQRNGLVLTYSGSLYQLGVVNPEYEAAYPDARKRLMTTLPEK
jgi:hypothetical protein